MYRSYLQVFFCKLPVSLACFSFFNQFIGSYLLDFRRAFTYEGLVQAYVFTQRVSWLFSSASRAFPAEFLLCVFT